MKKTRIFLGILFLVLLSTQSLAQETKKELITYVEKIAASPTEVLLKKILPKEAAPLQAQPAPVIKIVPVSPAEKKPAPLLVEQKPAEIKPLVQIVQAPVGEQKQVGVPLQQVDNSVKEPPAPKPVLAEAKPVANNQEPAKEVAPILPPVVEQLPQELVLPQNPEVPIPAPPKALVLQNEQPENAFENPVPKKNLLKCLFASFDTVADHRFAAKLNSFKNDDGETPYYLYSTTQFSHEGGLFGWIADDLPSPQYCGTINLD